MQKSQRRKYFIGASFILGLLIHWHNVPTCLTTEDKLVFESLWKNEKHNKVETFEQQLIIIQKIHARTLVISNTQEIALNTSREPKDFMRLQRGACYDRSRFIEKSLVYFGFDIRHISLFKIVEDQFNWKTLITKDASSHAALEVKTLNGWMIIDPSCSFLGLDRNNNVYSFKDLSKGIKAQKEINWVRSPSESLLDFYQKEVIKIYGLYSRHGRFFPPYNFVPDYNVRQLLFNI